MTEPSCVVKNKANSHLVSSDSFSNSHDGRETEKQIQEMSMTVKT